MATSVLIEELKKNMRYTNEPPPTCNKCCYSKEEQGGSGAPSDWETYCTYNKIATFAVKPTGRCNYFEPKVKK